MTRMFWPHGAESHKAEIDILNKKDLHREVFLICFNTEITDSRTSLRSTSHSFQKSQSLAILR